MFGHFRGWRSCAAITLIGLAAACGDDGSDPPETITVTADTATALRGSSTLVDVLANDRASAGGSLSLIRISAAPASGQAAIEGNRIRYTPNAGHLGGDRLSYVVGLASGAETVGELTVNTEARVLLKGTVTDGPIAGAAVQLDVGSRRVTATANAQGQYEVEAVLRQSAEMIRLEAAGVGAQAQVRLSSLLGSASALLAKAGTGAELGESALGSLRVSHVSTAVEALVLDANSGTAPATQAALEAAQSSLDPLQLINLAAVIKLVVDGGVALPAGTPDTLALVRSPSVRNTFATQNAAALSAMAAQLAGDPALGVAADSPLPLGATSVTQVYFFGRGAIGSTAYRVLYRADGTADVTGGNASGVKAARWSLDDGEINVRFDPAWSQQYTYLTSNPGTGLQEEVTDDVRLHALHIRMLAGTSVVQLASTTSVLRNGTEYLPITRGTPFVFQQRALAALETPLRTEDFPAGSRWGGLGLVPADTPLNSPPIGWAMPDLLEFRADGTARQTITGTELRWQVTAGVLELTRADGERMQFRRLQRVGASEERWLAELFPATGGPVQMMERLVVRQDPLLALSPANVSGLWLSQINLLTQEGTFRFFVRLRADGTSNTVSVSLNPSTGLWTTQEGGRIDNWQALTDGSLRILFTNTQVTPPLQNVRDWIPLSREGNKLMVLEWRASYLGVEVDRNRSESLSGWRVNIYTLEPASY